MNRVLNSSAMQFDPAGVEGLGDATFLQRWDPSGVFERIAGDGQRNGTTSGSTIRHKIGFAGRTPTHTIN